MADNVKVQYLFQRRERFSNNRLEPLMKNKEQNIINLDSDKRYTLTQNNTLQSYNKNEHSTFGAAAIVIYIRKKKRNRHKNPTKYKIFHCSKNKIIIIVRSANSKENMRIINQNSLPDVKTDTQNLKNLKHVQSSKIIQRTGGTNNNKNYIISNFCQTCDKREYNNPFMNHKNQPKVYRCQLNAREETCCCSCNSDAMFEVMKSLYDCYKKKNCNHCNCILCGSLPAGIKAGLGEQKSVAVGVGEKGLKEKMTVAKAAGLLSPLQGKSSEQKEKILKGLVNARLPLPKGNTASEKIMINKIRKDMGLPPEPKNAEERAKMDQALTAGIITPLEGKNLTQKEKALRKMAKADIPLPEGRTVSEKALIDKVRTEVSAVPGAIPVVKIPSEKVRKAKADGILTPLTGKTPAQRQKILRGLVDARLSLPEGKTASERKLIDKIRKDMGLPPEPKNAEERAKMEQALAAGIITPLEGKNLAQKEKALRKIAEAGIPLPEGRSTSEKALINKVKAEVGAVHGAIPAVKIASEKLRHAKADGILTPLAGKPPAQRQKILKGLVDARLPLSEGKTASEKILIDKIRKDMGLPPEPNNAEERAKMDQALTAGIITPLEGKKPAQKENALRKMAKAGIPLPEGRTASEKALINKVRAEVSTAPEAMPIVKITSENLRKAKAAGIITSLTGKTPAQRQKILKGLVDARLPLPEGKTTSERKLIDKIRKDMGLPPEPKNAEERAKMGQALAAGIITPLEGKKPSQKENALHKMAEAGISLPEGRTASEKALIDKVRAEVNAVPGAIPIVKITSENLRKAKAAGIITPLTGKTLAQRQKILKGLVDARLPLPEGKTASEKIIIDKIRKDMGLPPEPKNAEERAKMDQAHAAGIITPLEGKNPVQKQIALRKMTEAGIPLPEGRTASEKALIDKVKAEISAAPRATPILKIQSEKLRKAKAAGILTPLIAKTPAQRQKILKGLVDARLPLPEGKTTSEKKLIDKIRKDMGLPPEPKTEEERVKMDKALAAGIITPLEGKTPVQKEMALRKMAEAGIPLPKGRTPSEKAIINKLKDTGKSLPGIPSEKLRKAKAKGLVTPLAGKTPEQKANILKGLAKLGLPLPMGKTPSEIKLIEKIRKDMGLPPEPKNSVQRQTMAKAHAAGIISPLEGKSPAQKDKVLRRMAEAGVPLPEGRTASEKSLINKIRDTFKPLPGISSEKLRKAKAEGLLTSLAEKTPKQKENILKGLAKHGLPLPEGKSPSEKKLIDRIKKKMGLPPEPKNSVEKQKLAKAYAAGIISPLEGKSPAEKEKVLRRMADAGIRLPEGRTTSEKALINKIRDTIKPLPGIPSEKLRIAKADGLLTPLSGKTPEQKENILKGLAKHGLPLPEGKTSSEKKLIDKVRKDMGLPPESKNSIERQKMAKAHAAGIISPLEGKSPAQKEKVLRRMAEAGVSLPEGRTISEKALINKIRDTVKSLPGIPSEKLRKARAEGLLTPLVGKTSEQKEKILKGLAKHGLPLPQGQTPSEKKLIGKVRKDMGLPPESKNSVERQKMAKAHAAGIISPLEGKSLAEKEKVLRRMAEAGVSLPEGRTTSEKALINKIRDTVKSLPGIPSEKLRKARAEGLLTPLVGKTSEPKEKILIGLAKHGLPLPQGQTPSEKKLIDKVRKDMGLPPESKNSVERQKMAKAHAAGIISPLEGKSLAEKEKVLRRMAEAGVSLPEGRTTSEKALINNIRDTVKSLPGIPSEKLRKARAEGLLTPLAGKTSEQKEKILKGLAIFGLPLPQGKTPSEKKLIDKVRKDIGLPPEPKNYIERQKMAKAHAAGIISPLEGKSPAEKEKVFWRMADAGIPLPDGRTISEKVLIDKVTTGAKIKPIAAAEMRPPEKIGRPALPPDERAKLDIKTAKVKEGKGLSDECICDLLTPETERVRVPTPSVVKIPSEKFREAKAAGLLTPLEGKTSVQKQKILKGLADAGLPLPEGKTRSQKALINKMISKLGLPPTSTTPPEKEITKTAKAEGLFTPLAGKSPEQKSKIIKGLIDAGLPVPEGKTPSEKNLIKKLRLEAGLPAEPTTSEKRIKVRKKTMGVDAPAAKAKVKGVGAGEPPSKGGISEEIQEIVKTTKCDRACGCDKKKIRFKHSYVKIRITSPDISSFCPCPDDCIPGVKGGVFVDNEGIKVTVGRVTGIPLYIQSSASNKTVMSCVLSDRGDKFITYSEGKSMEHWKDYKHDTLIKNIYDCYNNFSSSNESIYNDEFPDYYFNTSKANINENKNNSVSSNGLTAPVYSYSQMKSTNAFQDGYIISCSDSSIFNSKSFTSLPNNIRLASYASNVANDSSIVLLQTELELNMSSSSYNSNLETLLSVISIDYPTNSLNSDNSKSVYELQKIGTDESDLSDIEIRHTHITASHAAVIRDSTLNSTANKPLNTIKFNETNYKASDQFIILRYSRNKKEKVSKHEAKDPQSVNPNKHDNIMKIVTEVIPKNKNSKNSSVYMLVSTEDNDSKNTVSTNLEHHAAPYFTNIVPIVTSENQINIATRGFKLISLPKGKEKKKKPKHVKAKENKQTNLTKSVGYEKHPAPQKHHHKDVLLPVSAKNKHTFGFDIAPGIVPLSQDKSHLLNVMKPYESAPMRAHTSEPLHFITVATNINQSPSEKLTKIKGVDTSCDRPCCCEINQAAARILPTPPFTSAHHGPQAVIQDINICGSIKDQTCAQNNFSPYSSPEDTLPCKCPPANSNKFNKQDLDSNLGNQSKLFQNGFCYPCCSRSEVADDVYKDSFHSCCCSNKGDERWNSSNESLKLNDCAEYQKAGEYVQSRRQKHAGIKRKFLKSDLRNQSSPEQNGASESKKVNSDRIDHVKCAYESARERQVKIKHGCEQNIQEKLRRQTSNSKLECQCNDCCREAATNKTFRSLQSVESFCNQTRKLINVLEKNTPGHTKQVYGCEALKKESFCGKIIKQKTDLGMLMSCASSSPPPLQPFIHVQRTGKRDEHQSSDSLQLRLLDPCKNKQNLCKRQSAGPQLLGPYANCLCENAENCTCNPPSSDYPENDSDELDDYIYNIEEIAWIHRRVNIELQSDLTQTTSGFKVVKKPKQKADEVLEDAIAYYEELGYFDNPVPEPFKTCLGCGDDDCLGLGQPGQLPPKPEAPQIDLLDAPLAKHRSGVTEPSKPHPVGHDACICESKEAYELATYVPPEGDVYCECKKGVPTICGCGKGGNVLCECPSEPSLSPPHFPTTPIVPPNSVFQGEGPPPGGFKFTIGAKGTGSPGLKGICCFDMIEDYREKHLKSSSESSTSSTYLIYTS